MYICMCVTVYVSICHNGMHWQNLKNIRVVQESVEAEFFICIVL